MIITYKDGYVTKESKATKIIKKQKVEFIDTNVNCCTNCKGLNNRGHAWLYCEIFNDNCDTNITDSEKQGCNQFVK